MTEPFPFEDARDSMRRFAQEVRVAAGADREIVIAEPAPAHSPGAIKAAIAAAYDSIIVRNSLTRPEGYSPYCMRCSGFYRMKQVGLLKWAHQCGAQHDEATARDALLNYKEPDHG